ncbi:hypothetical protein BJF84_19855 [Rhodococcus sp. CUA-806]|nr:hypothetical protein BJF84_19855 [Rhodococcus sp. CUA-806]
MLFTGHAPSGGRTLLSIRIAVTLGEPCVIVGAIAGDAVLFTGHAPSGGRTLLSIRIAVTLGEPCVIVGAIAGDAVESCPSSDP